jgi:hypothetical protein
MPAAANCIAELAASRRVRINASAKARFRHEEEKRHHDIERTTEVARMTRAAGEQQSKAVFHSIQP